MTQQEKVRAQRRIFAERFKAKFIALDTTSDAAIKRLLTVLESELNTLTNDTAICFTNSDASGCSDDE